MDHGFRGEHSIADMILIDTKGKKRSRKLEFQILEGIAKGDKTTIRFLAPADIRNTTLLTHEQKQRDDDQWLYLPALKRVKRIAASNKSSSFQGSEFTYEDLSPKEISKYDYQLLRTESCEDAQCWVVEAKPRFKSSGYSKTQSWIRHDNHQSIRQDFYDKRDKLLKRSKITGLKKLNNQFWRADVIHMVNLKTKKETLLKSYDRKIDPTLQARSFTKRAIQQ